MSVRECEAGGAAAGCNSSRATKAQVRVVAAPQRKSSSSMQHAAAAAATHDEGHLRELGAALGEVWCHGRVAAELPVEAGGLQRLQALEELGLEAGVRRVVVRRREDHARALQPGRQRAALVLHRVEELGDRRGAVLGVDLGAERDALGVGVVDHRLHPLRLVGRRPVEALEEDVGLDLDAAGGSALQHVLLRPVLLERFRLPHHPVVLQAAAVHLAQVHVCARRGIRRIGVRGAWRGAHTDDAE